MPSQADPDELLGDLLASLCRDEPLTPAARCWLLQGFASLAMGEAASLDAALGLTRQGGRAARLATRLRKQARDAILRQALDAVTLDGDMPAWPRCVRLADEIQAFQRSARALQMLEQPLPDWSAVRRAIWGAARLGMRLPTTPNGLWSALVETGDCFQSEDRPTILSHANTLSAGNR